MTQIEAQKYSAVNAKARRTDRRMTRVDAIAENYVKSGSFKGKYGL